MGFHAIRGLWIRGVAMGPLAPSAGPVGPDWIPRPLAPAFDQAVWLAGLIVGLLRYLKGPDLGRPAAGLETARPRCCSCWSGCFWSAWRFASDSPVSGWGGFLYGLDLKGRLLSYLAGLAALVIIVGEWLLLQEHSQAGFLKNPVQAWKTGLAANRGPALG